MSVDVAVRPYVIESLEKLSQYYEMAVFTAAEQTYADKIIDVLDPDKKYFTNRLYRQHCIERTNELNGGKVYIKDLRVIEDRGL